MSLFKAREAAKKKQIVSPDLVIDLTKVLGEGTKLTFRTPGVPDFFPHDAAQIRFAATFPALLPMMKVILIMAACYVPDEGEDVSPVDEIANLALEARDVFIYVMNQFNEAFPTNNLAKEIEATKND